jgi:magnesium-transporting ATPase (P-type)
MAQQGNNDEEEGNDMVGSMRAPRTKTTSDTTGMDHVDGKPPMPRRRVKAVSDISNMVMEKHVPNHANRKRQVSASDVVTTFQENTILQMDDLKLADHVAAYGTANERKGTMTDEDFHEKIEEDVLEDFAFNHKGLTTAEAEALLLKYGRNELPETKDPLWLVFLRLFWAPMPIMIWIAIIIEAAIQNWIDMAILLVIQFANASISFYETTKAGNAVAALKSSLKPTATCKRDGKWQVIDGSILVPGDTVLLGSGSAIPADCRVNGSEIDVDQAALTGESLPVTFYKGDSCKMGSTVVRGEVEVRLMLLVHSHLVYPCQELTVVLLSVYRELLSSRERIPFLAKPQVFSRKLTNTVTCR